MARNSNRNNNRNNNRGNNRGGNMNIGNRSAGTNTNAGRNPMGGGRANNQPQRQGNQSGINGGNNQNRAPRTGGPNGLGFAGDYPNTFGGPWDFGRNPNAPVNGTYVNSAGETRGMSADPNALEGLYVNAQNNDFKWTNTPQGLGVLNNRYGSLSEALNADVSGRSFRGNSTDWPAYFGMLNQQQGSVGLQAIKKAEQRGATKEQIDRYVAQSGINLGQSARDAGYGTNPYAQTGDWGNPAGDGASAQPSSGASSSGTASGFSKQNKLGANLRAAVGDNNVLNHRELMQISRMNKKDPEKVLEKAVNRGMFIRSGVVNKYQKGRYTNPMVASTRAALPDIAMAAGMDNAILQQLRNAGRQDRGSALFIGSRGNTATTLPIGMGFGSGYRPPGGNTNTATPTATGTGTAGPSTISTAPVSTAPMTPAQMADASTVSGPGMLSGGGMGAAGASKLGRANSRLRKLGINSRGTSLLGRGLQYGSVLNA